MKYIIEWSEKKTTSTGKEKIDATLKDEQGNTVDKVTIWADFPDFDKLMTGFTVDGDIVTKQNGTFTNRTLYPAKKWNASAQGGGKTATISKAMDRKEGAIAASQDKKEMAIILSSSARAATEMTIALMSRYEGLSFDELKQEWKEWRKWFYESHGDSENLPDYLK